MLGSCEMRLRKRLRLDEPGCFQGGVQAACRLCIQYADPTFSEVDGDRLLGVHARLPVKPDVEERCLVADAMRRLGECPLQPHLCAELDAYRCLLAHGLHAWGWVALAALVLGLVAAAILLAPWKLKFAMDARELYDELYEQAAREAPADILGWFGHPRLVGGSGLRIPGPAQEERGEGAAHAVPSSVVIGMQASASGCRRCASNDRLLE